MYREYRSVLIQFSHLVLDDGEILLLADAANGLGQILVLDILELHAREDVPDERVEALAVREGQLGQRVDPQGLDN